MTTLERELLESIAGTRTHHADGNEIRWGAWMTACLESLEGGGFVAANHRAKGYTYEITPKGRAAIAGQ